MIIKKVGMVLLSVFICTGAVFCFEALLNPTEKNIAILFWSTLAGFGFSDLMDFKLKLYPNKTM